jgi:hypothetical protein
MTEREDTAAARLFRPGILDYQADLNKGKCCNRFDNTMHPCRDNKIVQQNADSNSR